MLYQTIRSELTDLLAKFKSKSYPRIVTARKELLSVIDKYCELWVISNTNEKIWLFMHNEQPKYCQFGNKLPFKTYDTGYRSHCSLTCKCKGLSHSLKLTQYYIDNPEMKTQIQETKEATCLATYGVKNHMQDKAALIAVQAKMIEKYGAKSNVERTTVIDKIKAKNILSCGVEYPFQSSEIRDKANTSFIAHYGVENTMQYARAKIKEMHGVDSLWQTASGQKTAKAGMKNKYGVEYPLQSSTILEKMITRNIEKYSRINPAQCHITDENYAILQDKDQFAEFTNGKTLRFIAESLGIDQKTVWRYSVNYNIWDEIKTRSRSQYEDEIENWLIDNDISYKTNDRTLCKPKEIDFFLPEYDVAIEFNGIYYHCELSGGKVKRYHEDKMISCKNANIQLITIFENEWHTSKEIIKNKILYLCNKAQMIKHGARSATIKQISYNESKLFLNTYHIQGDSRNSTIIYGAFISDILVGVMCMGTSKNGFWDITRFATSCSVSGLFSKILSVFVDEYNPWCIDTIADLRYSYGKLYEQTGFVNIDNIDPDYYYTTDHVNLYRKEMFRKCKIKQKFKLSEDVTEFTEWPKMQELGYDRIWDCGKIKYRWYNAKNIA